MQENHHKVARDALLLESDTLRIVAERLGHEFDQAVEMIAECPGMLTVMGMGKSGMIGRKLASTFSSLGIPAYFLHAVEALHGDVGAVRTDSLVLALSHSGKTAELLKAIELVSDRGIPSIAITQTDDSPLSAGCHVALTYGEVCEADHLGLAPTTSATIMMALGDALAIALSRKRNFTRGDFLRCHPGGELGKLGPLDPEAKGATPRHAEPPRQGYEIGTRAACDQDSG